MTRRSTVVTLLSVFLWINAHPAGGQVPTPSIESVPCWGRFELTATNSKAYRNPCEDVRLEATFIKPDGGTVAFWGFYDGGDAWRVRFMPDQVGTWRYQARFSDGVGRISGVFECVASDLPGLISVYRDNPIWFGFKHGPPVLIRSLHVGDRFFADGDNSVTGAPWSAARRRAFLDWAQAQGYNMLSIASHYLNRDTKGRGQGWDTPDLWDADTQQPNWREFRRMETILNNLAERRIMVYPFAGFCGRDSDFPRDEAKQDLYLKYTLARLGAYWNLWWMVGGPEPRLKGKPYLTVEQIDRLGHKLEEFDVFGHLRSVHNPTGPDQFKDAAWTSYGILQGPKTVDRAKLSLGLLASHHDAKPLYAQETLWPGNKYHPNYTLDDVRKNAFVLMMSAATINFADMDGDSSSSFSGSMDLAQCVQARHDVVREVWDFFETVPFWRMKPRQDLVDTGYCLAEPGRHYLVYLESPGSITVQIDEGSYRAEWINAQNAHDIHSRGVVTCRQALTSPRDGDDWLLSLRSVEAADGTRLFPVDTVRGP